MRIPAGADFINSGHFSGMFVFHGPSRTLFVDDTLSYYDENTSWALNTLSWCFGARPNTVRFHPTAFSDRPDQGLTNSESSAGEFESFLRGVVTDWDFDNLCTAHSGVRQSGAKALVEAALTAYAPQLAAFAQKHKGH